MIARFFMAGGGERKARTYPVALPMPARQLSNELVTDLLRSAWLVEAARARVFEAWSVAGERFADAATLAAERANVLGANLRRRGGAPDGGLVEDHARWMTSCVAGPHEPFADLFLARLGGWVDAHAAAYLGEDAERLLALGERERAGLVFPEGLPPLPDPPPLEAGSQARREGTRLRVGVLGDLHAGSRRAEARVAAAIADLNAATPDLVVQLGDLTDRGEEPEFGAAARLLARVDAPVEVIIGNHDVYCFSEDALRGRERFRRWFGREADGRLLETRGVRLLLLDSAEEAFSPFPPYDLVAGAFGEGRGGAMVTGSLTPAQHDLLAEVASPHGDPALVFLHHPPQPFTGFPPVIFGLNDVDSGRLHATCDSGNVWGVFAGHTHRNHRGAGFDGVPVLEVAAPRDYPFGYALIDVGERGYRYRFHQISDRELVVNAAAGVNPILRRYSVGAERDRAFDWAPE